MKRFALLIFAISTQALAKDPNFLTPADLPTTSYRIYVEEGRPPAPNFPEHYGEAQAMKSDLGEEYCHSKIGRQLSPWVRTITDNGFDGPFARYEFEVKADFACEPPTLSTVVPTDTAVRLFDALPIAAKGDAHQKRADVLCYDKLEQVCNDGVLMNYNEYLVCEVTDLDDPSHNAVLTDADLADNTQTKQGAHVLEDLLPLYRDTRSDEKPEGNCKPPIAGRLKGDERKAATITCTDDPKARAARCLVEGIIKI